ncbi:MAG: FHA domain-containing protein [Bacteriovoracaceae bacterium]|nr:FHA domain-containing protein [Bacteriovoracaceae bacterium]
MRLICKLINGEELEFEISKPSFVIGRSNQADIIIPHEGMSRRHCLIENKNGQFFITDLESSNGVFIDEKRIQPNIPTVLPEYLNLSFGAVQSLRIEHDETVNFATPSPKPLMNQGHKTNPELKRPHPQRSTGKHDLTKKKAESKPSNTKNIVLTIVTIIILVFMGYIYYQDKKMENAPLTPEEMYE